MLCVFVRVGVCEGVSQFVCPHVYAGVAPLGSAYQERMTSFSWPCLQRAPTSLCACVRHKHAHTLAHTLTQRTVKGLDVGEKRIQIARFHGDRLLICFVESRRFLWGGGLGSLRVCLI